MEELSTADIWKREANKSSSSVSSSRHPLMNGWSSCLLIRMRILDARVKNGLDELGSAAEDWLSCNVWCVGKDSHWWARVKNSVWAEEKTVLRNYIFITHSSLERRGIGWQSRANGKGYRRVTLISWKSEGLHRKPSVRQSDILSLSFDSLFHFFFLYGFFSYREREREMIIMCRVHSVNATNSSFTEIKMMRERTSGNRIWIGMYIHTDGEVVFGRGGGDDDDEKRWRRN